MEIDREIDIHLKYIYAYLNIASRQELWADFVYVWPDSYAFVITTNRAMFVQAIILKVVF